MNRTDALRSMQRMIFMFGGRESWDEATIASWADQIVTLEDHDAAQEATMQLVRTWDQPGRPPYAVWLQAYEAIRRRYVTNHHRMSLPPSMAREPMPPSAYMASLMEAARKGDQTAITELGNFWRSKMGQSFLDKRELIALGVDVAEKWDHKDGTVRHLFAVED